MIANFVLRGCALLREFALFSHLPQAAQKIGEPLPRHLLAAEESANHCNKFTLQWVEVYVFFWYCQKTQNTENTTLLLPPVVFLSFLRFRCRVLSAFFSPLLQQGHGSLRILSVRVLLVLRQDPGEFQAAGMQQGAHPLPALPLRVLNVAEA